MTNGALCASIRERLSMENKLIIVAALFIHPGREAEFEQFETAAESIMRRYGGRIERRIGFAASADPISRTRCTSSRFPTGNHSSDIAPMRTCKLSRNCAPARFVIRRFGSEAI